MVSTLPREGSYIKYTEVILFVKPKFTNFFSDFQMMDFSRIIFASFNAEKFHSFHLESI